MNISLSALKQFESIERIEIQSIDPSIYRAVVIHLGEQKCLTDDKGHPLTTRNLTAMREHFSGLSVCELVLWQQSAYDEMISQPMRDHNRLEIPLSTNTLALSSLQNEASSTK